MNSIMGVTLAALAKTETSAFAGQVKYGTGVFSPEAGVICDRQGQFCVDGTWLSTSWTEQNMSAEASGKLANVERSVFGYSNHAKCTDATWSCGVATGKTAKKMTTMLFNNS